MASDTPPSSRSASGPRGGDAQDTDGTRTCTMQDGSGPLPPAAAAILERRRYQQLMTAQRLVDTPVRVPPGTAMGSPHTIDRTPLSHNNSSSNTRDPDATQHGVIPPGGGNKRDPVGRRRVVTMADADDPYAFVAHGRDDIITVRPAPDTSDPATNVGQHPTRYPLHFVYVLRQLQRPAAPAEGSPSGATSVEQHPRDVACQYGFLKMGVNTVGRCTGRPYNDPYFISFDSQQVGVSKVHAHVTVARNGDVWVEDSKSTNGTYIATSAAPWGRRGRSALEAGIRLEQKYKHQLRAGDRVSFGDIHMVLIIRPATDAELLGVGMDPTGYDWRRTYPTGVPTVSDGIIGLWPSIGAVGGSSPVNQQSQEVVPTTSTRTSNGNQEYQPQQSTHQRGGGRGLDFSRGSVGDILAAASPLDSPLLPQTGEVGFLHDDTSMPPPPQQRPSDEGSPLQAVPPSYSNSPLDADQRGPGPGIPGQLVVVGEIMTAGTAPGTVASDSGDLFCGDQQPGAARKRSRSPEGSTCTDADDNDDGPMVGGVVTEGKEPEGLPDVPVYDKESAPLFGNDSCPMVAADDGDVPPPEPQPKQQEKPAGNGSLQSSPTNGDAQQEPAITSRSRSRSVTAVLADVEIVHPLADVFVISGSDTDASEPTSGPTKEKKKKLPVAPRGKKSRAKAPPKGGSTKAPAAPRGKKASRGGEVKERDGSNTRREDTVVVEPEAEVEAGVATTVPSDDGGASRATKTKTAERKKQQQQQEEEVVEAVHARGAGIRGAGICGGGSNSHEEATIRLGTSFAVLFTGIGKTQLPKYAKTVTSAGSTVVEGFDECDAVCYEAAPAGGGALFKQLKTLHGGGKGGDSTRLPLSPSTGTRSIETGRTPKLMMAVAAGKSLLPSAYFTATMRDEDGNEAGSDAVASSAAKPRPKKASSRSRVGATKRGREKDDGTKKNDDKDDNTVAVPAAMLVPTVVCGDQDAAVSNDVIPATRVAAAIATNRAAGGCFKGKAFFLPGTLNKQQRSIAADIIVAGGGTVVSRRGLRGAETVEDADTQIFKRVFFPPEDDGPQ